MSLAMRLNRRVTIQSPSSSHDAIGQPVQSWVTFDTVWAEVKDISGREYVASGGLQSEAQTKILIRKLAGILPSMRVQCGSDIYVIKSILGQDNRTQTLMCARYA